MLITRRIHVFCNAVKRNRNSFLTAGPVQAGLILAQRTRLKALGKKGSYVNWRSLWQGSCDRAIRNSKKPTRPDLRKPAATETNAAPGANKVAIKIVMLISLKLSMDHC